VIRIATSADAEAIAQVHIQAWRVAYRGIVPDAFLDNLLLADHAQQWEKNLNSTASKTLVFEIEDQVQGWVCFGNGRDKGEDAALEIYALYINPHRWRSGIGRQLVEAVKQHDSRTNIYLWVLESNSSAQHFYDSMAFINSGDTKTISWAGVRLEELKYTHFKQEH
jgi:ribosomal protein S18 acetylase RimI-like enzyme